MLRPRLRVSMGLVIYPSQPASIAFCSSPFMAKAVSATTLISRVAGSCLMLRVMAAQQLQRFFRAGGRKYLVTLIHKQNAGQLQIDRRVIDNQDRLASHL